MKALWRPIEHNYGGGGVRKVFRKVFSRLQEWLWSESTWLIYKIDVERRQIGLDSLLELKHFKAVAFPEIIQTRLDAGARCNAFFVGSELVNIAWTTVGYLELEPGLCIRETGCAGIYDCYALPGLSIQGHLHRLADPVDWGVCGGGRRAGADCRGSWEPPLHQRNREGRLPAVLPVDASSPVRQEFLSKARFPQAGLTGSRLKRHATDILDP